MKFLVVLGCVMAPFFQVVAHESSILLITHIEYSNNFTKLASRGSAMATFGSLQECRVAGEHYIKSTKVPGIKNNIDTVRWRCVDLKTNEVLEEN